MIIENFIRLLAGAVIAGCWWFVAIRLQKYWFLYAIAALATVGPLLSSGMAVLAQIMPRGSGASMLGMTHVWTVVSISNAILFVLFATWLVRFARTAPQA